MKLAQNKLNECDDQRFMRSPHQQMSTSVCNQKRTRAMDLQNTICGNKRGHAVQVLLPPLFYWRILKKKRQTTRSVRFWGWGGSSTWYYQKGCTTHFTLM